MPLTEPAADQVMKPPRNTAAPAKIARLPFAVVSANRTEKLFFAFMTLSFVFNGTYRIKVVGGSGWVLRAMLCAAFVFILA